MSVLSAILVNGKQFFGKKLQIEVRIDGKRIDMDKLPQINIVVQGNLDTLEVGAAHAIEVHGSVSSLSTGSGDVKCGDVTGNVSTGSGTVDCGDVHGSVATASGDVDCVRIGGNIKTVSGDVTSRTA
jgi:hypothetical protein